MRRRYSKRPSERGTKEKGDMRVGITTCIMGMRGVVPRVCVMGGVGVSCALLICRGGGEAHKQRGQPQRARVLIPDRDVNQDGQDLADVADDGEGGGGDGGAAQEGEVTHRGAEGAPGQG